MIGVVDVGGGERGAYGAGVLDFCMERGIDFDVCVGVSAGAANMCSYLAGQVGRNFAFYTNYSFRPEYMGLGRVLQKREYADLDYIYGSLTNSDGEYPLDYPAMVASGKDLLIVAPDDIGKMGTLTKDRAEIETLYAKGMRDAFAIERFLA